MRISRSNLVAASLGAAFLVACGGGSNGLITSTPLAVPGAGLPHSLRSHPSHRVLTNVAGTLYGTTYDGGSQNEGTVYSITPSGTETVLHNFTGGGNDGEYPLAGLVAVNGTLYGTTYEGGSPNEGTVYSITAAGAYTELHVFVGGGNDGAYPRAGLIAVNGTLYGTTYEGGGPQNEGTVFKIETNGAYTQLHNFVGGGNDGAYPLAGLLAVNGTLYGTTYEGGGGGECYLGSQNIGCGTVFKMATNGAYTQLHNFVGGGNDGTYPLAGLIAVNGTLYGTTKEGGGGGECYSGSQNIGCGTVFKMATNGAYTQLHNFVGGGNDGAYPGAGLTNVNGTLYGTTSEGGLYECSSGFEVVGCGTVFKMATNGAYTQLYAFAGGIHDGSAPDAGLTYWGGSLFGTTFGGGLTGGGTVFKMTTSGAYLQLHNFAGGIYDGAEPASALWVSPPVPRASGN